MDSGNLFEPIPAQLRAEAVETLAQSGATRIERIISKGHCSPPGFWYDQEDNEWVLLARGEATLRFEKDDRVVHLAAGDYVNIAAHERHRVDWTKEGEETVWLAVFYSSSRRERDDCEYSGENSSFTKLPT